MVSLFSIGFCRIHINKRSQPLVNKIYTCSIEDYLKLIIIFVYLL